MAKLSHYGAKGQVRMVDVSAKAVTTRTAVAQGFVKMKPRVVQAGRRLRKTQRKPPGGGRTGGNAAADKTQGGATRCSPPPRHANDAAAEGGQEWHEGRSH